VSQLRDRLLAAGVDPERADELAKEIAASDRVQAEAFRGKIEYWKQIIYVQTHFNDMCIRTRWVGLTVNATIYAGAAVALAQYPSGAIAIAGVSVHIAAILFAIAGLVSIGLWQLDRMYYYNMLIAAVEHAETVEDRLSDLIPEFIGDRSLTHAITDKVSRKKARGVVELLYWGMCIIPFLLGLITLFIATSDDSQSAEGAASEAAIVEDDARNPALIQRAPNPTNAIPVEEKAGPPPAN
jgi:hypothetical protein